MLRAKPNISAAGAALSVLSMPFDLAIRLRWLGWPAFYITCCRDQPVLPHCASRERVVSRWVEATTSIAVTAAGELFKGKGVSEVAAAISVRCECVCGRV